MRFYIILLPTDQNRLLKNQKHTFTRTNGLVNWRVFLIGENNKNILVTLCSVWVESSQKKSNYKGVFIKFSKIIQ